MSARKVQATHNKVMVGKVYRPNGAWQIRTTVSTFDQGGKLRARLQSYRTFHGDEREAEAERIRVLWLARGKPGMVDFFSRFTQGSLDTISLADWAYSWLESKEKEGRVSKETARVRRSRVVNLVIPAWGGLQLTGLHWRVLMDGLEWLGEQGYSRSTVTHALSLLSAIVTDAGENGLAYLPDCELMNLQGQNIGV